jgi:DNA-binding NtrC family response regulator
METATANKNTERHARERELFITVLREAYRNYLLQLGKRPTQYDVAEELSVSRATLNRKMERYGTSWTEISLLAVCGGCSSAPSPATVSQS